MGEKLQIYFNNEQLEKIVALAGTTDKAEVTKFIKEKSLLDLTGTQSKLSAKEKAESLKNLKLTLECWKLLNEQFPQMPMQQRIEILNGSQTLQSPDTPVTCDHCSHIHHPVTKICNERMCMCGLR